MTRNGLHYLHSFSTSTTPPLRKAPTRPYAYYPILRASATSGRESPTLIKGMRVVDEHMSTGSSGG